MRSQEREVVKNAMNRQMRDAFNSFSLAATLVETRGTPKSKGGYQTWSFNVYSVRSLDLDPEHVLWCTVRLFLRNCRWRTIIVTQGFLQFAIVLLLLSKTTWPDGCHWWKSKPLYITNHPVIASSNLALSSCWQINVDSTSEGLTMLDFQTIGNSLEMPSSPVPQFSLLAVCTGLPWLLRIWSNLVYLCPPKLLDRQGSMSRSCSWRIRSKSWHSSSSSWCTRP